MRKLVMAAALLGAAGVMTLPEPVPANAQEVRIEVGPGYRHYRHRRYYRERYYEPQAEYYGYRRYRAGPYPTFNGCRPGWTVQDGRCRPYRGF